MNDPYLQFLNRKLEELILERKEKRRGDNLRRQMIRSLLKQRRFRREHIRNDGNITERMLARLR